MKFLRKLLIILLILIAISFTLVNRTEIAVELWPLPLTVITEVGLVILLAASVGFIVGIFCTLIGEQSGSKKKYFFFRGKGLSKDK